MHAKRGIVCLVTLGILMTSWVKRVARVCCAVLLGCTALPAACAELIRISTSELPPFSIDGNAAAPGALLEMVEELLRRSQRSGTIEFVPWRRALLLSTQPRSAIFPLTRSVEREGQYRWLARLYHEHFLFVTLDERQFDVRTPERHKNRRIGMLRGSVMTSTLRKLGYRHIVEAASVDEGIRFLKRGIVDAVFGDRAIIERSMRDSGAASYAMSEPLYTTTTWLAGSPDFTEADAQLFHRGMKEMVDDGTHARILKKYQLPSTPASVPLP
jgi:polar amino acid transport system substrate-binding protein